MDSGFTPLLLAFIELCNLQMLFNITLINSQNVGSVLIHFLEGLRDDEGLFSLASEDQELDAFALGSFGLAEIRNHQSALRSLALTPENMLGFLRIVQVFKVQADQTFEVVGSFVCFLSFFILFLYLSTLGDHNQNSRRRNLINERSHKLEFPDLNVNADGFFEQSSLLVKLSSFRPLLHLLADTSYLNDQILLGKI